MNFNIFHLTASEMGIALALGAACAFIYMYLLWTSVKLLPGVKHKGLFLFISGVLRLFLLIFGMLILANDSGGKFILIFCGFVITRLLILQITCFGKCQRTNDTNIKNSFEKKTELSGKYDYHYKKGKRK